MANKFVGFLLVLCLLFSFGFVFAAEGGGGSGSGNSNSCASDTPPLHCTAYSDLKAGNSPTKENFQKFVDDSGDNFQQEISELVTGNSKARKALGELLRNGFGTGDSAVPVDSALQARIVNGLVSAHSAHGANEAEDKGESPANEVMSAWVGKKVDLGDLSSEKLKGEIKVNEGRIEIGVNDRSKPIVIPTTGLPETLESISVEGNVVKNKRDGGGVLEISDDSYAQANDDKKASEKEKKRWKLAGFKMGNGDELKDGDYVTVNFNGDGAVRVGDGEVEATGSGNVGIKKDGKGTLAFSGTKGKENSRMKAEFTDADTVTLKGSNAGLGSIFDKNGENPVRIRYSGSGDMELRPWGKGESDAYETESPGNRMILDSSYSGSSSLESIKISGDVKKADGLEMEFPTGVKLEGGLTTKAGTVTSGEVKEGEKPSESQVRWDGSFGKGKVKISGGNVNVPSIASSSKKGTSAVDIAQAQAGAVQQQVGGMFTKIDTPINGVKYSNVYSMNGPDGRTYYFTKGENSQTYYGHGTDPNVLKAGDTSTFNGVTLNAGGGYPGGPYSSNANTCSGGRCGGRCSGGSCYGYNYVPGQPVRNVLRAGGNVLRGAGRVIRGAGRVINWARPGIIIPKRGCWGGRCG